MKQIMKQIMKQLSFILIIVMVVTTCCVPMQANAAESVKYVEELKVTGGYFDSGMPINQNYSLEMSFSMSNLAIYSNLFYTQDKNVYTLRNESKNGLFIRHGWYNEKAYQPEADEDIVLTQKKNITYINGKQVRKAVVQKIQSASDLMFGNFIGTIKYFKIWNESDNLVGDFNAAIDAGGKACMYDKVSGKYVYYTGKCIAVETAQNDTAADSTTTKSDSASETTPSTPDKDATIDKDEAAENTNTTVNYVDALQIEKGYFDSGVTINQNVSLEMTFSLSALTQYTNLFYTDDGNVYILRNESTGGLYMRHGWYNDRIYKPAVNEEVTILEKKNVTYVNGELIRKMTLQTRASTSNLRFGKFQGTIKSFRIWDADGNLQNEFLPAKDANNKACMYDTVNKKYVYYTGACTAIETETKDENVVIEKNNTESMDSDYLIKNDTTGSDGATDTGTDTIVQGKNDDAIYGEKIDTSGLNENEQAVYDILAEMYEKYDNSVVDVSQYKVTYESFYNKIAKLLNKAYYWNHFLAYNIYPTCGISGKYVTTVKIDNIDSDFYNRKARTEAAIQEYLAGIDGKMTDLDKVVWAHEFVVGRTVYNAKATACDNASGALGDGKAKCSGYAEAMQLLLHKAGIETDQVGSSSMYHTWLAVKLDGEWYHIDPTWDDTTKTSEGLNAHTYLLRIKADFKNHYSWKYGYQGEDGSSTKYTNWFVHDVPGTMYYYNGLWYYTNAAMTAVYASDINGDNKKELYTGSEIKLNGIKNGILYYTEGTKNAALRIINN